MRIITITIITIISIIPPCTNNSMYFPLFLHLFFSWHELFLLLHLTILIQLFIPILSNLSILLDSCIIKSIDFELQCAFTEILHNIHCYVLVRMQLAVVINWMTVLTFYLGDNTHTITYIIQSSISLCLLPCLSYISRNDCPSTSVHTLLMCPYRSSQEAPPS